jgi:hypothetical protein
MYRMLQDWSQETATWDSFVNGVTADGVEAVTTPTATWDTINLTVPFETNVDVTADIKLWSSNGAPNYGWAILPTANDGYRIDPSEHATELNRPTLTIDYAPPPPGVPVSITQNPQSVTTNESATVRLTVGASGSPPLHYQWFKNGAPLSDGGRISGATSAQLTIASALPGAGGDNGNYFCRVSNDVPSSTNSATATVTINLDLTRPNVVNVSGGTTSTIVTIVFSKAVSAATAQNTANYSISPSLTISSAVLDGTGTTVTLTTAARTAGTKYTITIKDIRDTRVSQNLLDPNPTVLPLIYQIALLNFTDVWTYDDTGTDLGTAWRDNSFNDSTWKSGPGVLGFETTATTLTFLQSIAPPNGTNTVLSLTNSAGVTNITEYFRTTFNNPLSGAALAGVTYLMRAYIDDGAVWYLNGTEAGRYNISNTPTVYNTLADAALTEPTPAPQTTFITTAIRGVVSGLNHFAAEVHQNTPIGSSDIDWGAEIVASIGQPSLTIALEGANVRIRWRPAVGTLQSTDTLNNAPTWNTQTTGQLGPGEYLVPANQAHRFYSLRP